MQISQKETFRGIVRYLDGDTTFAVRGRTIYRRCGDDQPWNVFARTPASLIEKFKWIHPYSRRLFRRGIHHLTMSGDNIVIWAGNEIQVFNRFSGQLVSSGERIHGSRPLVVCTSEGSLMYGEYRKNNERSPVGIWRSIDDGLTWQCAYSFMGVRHIHGVFKDPFSEHLWVTTGDNDEECGIWRTDPNFLKVEQVLGGSQQLRAIQLLFSDDRIYFGSDTPLERNHLYSMQRDSWKVDRLANVDGSVFYGQSVGKTHFFSTACEPSAINRRRESTVWVMTLDGEWKEILSFRKDPLSLKYFQYGQVLFPAGSGASKTSFWITPFATRNDQKSLRFDFKNED